MEISLSAAPFRVLTTSLFAVLVGCTRNPEHNSGLACHTRRIVASVEGQSASIVKLERIDDRVALSCSSLFRGTSPELDRDSLRTGSQSTEKCSRAFKVFQLACAQGAASLR